MTDETTRPEGEATTTAAEPTERPQTPKLGYLLDEPDEAKVCAFVTQKLLEPTQKADDRRWAFWERNKLWRQGKRYLNIVESDDRYEVRAPAGTLATPPVDNKVDDLCRRIVSQLTTDPPVPDVTPEGDSDDERDAAELSMRLLVADGTPEALNDKGILRTAVDKGTVYGSVFSYHTVDPQGGGWRPLEVQAHPQAVAYDAANPTAVLLDPATNAPTSEYVRKYVRPDGSLSDSPVGAALQWQPAEVEELLTGHAVRLLPETATSVKDAKGILILCYHTVGDLKAILPESVGTMDQAALKKLVSWRPKKVKRLLPAHASEPKGESSNGTIDDDALVFSLKVYYRSHGGPAGYPKGAYVWVSPSGTLLHREAWSRVRKTRDGGEVEECLELPVAQCRQLDDTITDDPLGYGIVQVIGPGDEQRAMLWGYVMEYLERAGRPHTFLPLGSVVQPGQLQMRTGEPILVNPQGKPEQEKVEPLSPLLPEMLAQIEARMDSGAGMGQTAQGEAAPSVKSGAHARELIEQALVALSTIKQNADDFMSRRWRLRLQLRRCFYTQAQRLQYEGDDGAYREKVWTGADLSSSKEIRVARGRSTLMAPSAKHAIAREELEVGLAAMDAEAYTTYLERTRDNLSSVVGAQVDPHRQRVRRQITAWKDGPPEGWMPPMPAPMAAPAPAFAPEQTGMPPATPPAMGTMVPGMGTPVDPANPFSDARPNDEEPLVAVARHRELSRVMSTTAYAKHPPEWRAYLDAEYDRMRRAAGVSTAAEAALAQQQAAQQQADAEASKQESQSADKAADRDAKAQESEAQRQHQMLSQERDGTQQMAVEAMRQSAKPAAA